MPEIRKQEEAPTLPKTKAYDDMDRFEVDSSAGASADSPSSGTMMSTQNDSSKGTGRGKGDSGEAAIAAKENRNVFRLRLIVLCFLLASTVGVAVGVHRYVSNSEQAEFEQQFQDASEKVLEAIGSTLAHTLGSADAFLVALVSYARATNSSWPFVTYPDYAVHLAKLRSLSKAVLVSQYHYVTGEQRAEWESYAPAHDSWVQDGIDTQKVDETFQGKIVTEYWTRNDIHDSAEAYDAPGPYLPKWQQSPVIPIYAPYSWDAMTFPSLARALPAVQGDRKIALGDVSNIANMSDPDSVRQEAGNNDFIKDYVGDEEDETEPFSDIYFPILDYSADYVTIPKNVSDPASLGNFVGVFAMTFYWRDLMRNILPAALNGLVVVFENTCGQSFTYQVDGPDTLYLGRDDIHEKKYDGFLVRSSNLLALDAFANTINDRSYTGLDLSEKGCQYNISVYPSTGMEESIKSNDPIIFMLVAVAIFAFTSIIFVVYDYMVERRQAKVMASAVHTNAIVSSLFPSNVRDRLFHTDPSQTTSTEQKRAFEHDKTRLKTFLSSEGRQTAADSSFENNVGTNNLSSRPIADLFPDCTVQFCDIAGFTAWSSVREPSQVFTLLETLYGAFDAIAMRRSVFKVETIGDAYVAVCGLPEKREDHALVMAKFSRDCILKANDIFRSLVKSLGSGTDELRLRFGLHSGPVTAGVLRGQKSRFQLFGDTVNTAARMESTGKPNKVQLSTTTADLLIASGKRSWVKKREDLVEAKGKGTMQTFWLDMRMMGSHATATTNSEGSAGAAPHLDEKTKRLVEWNHDVLSQLLKQVVVTRKVVGESPAQKRHSAKAIVTDQVHGNVIDEVCEIVDLPEFNAEAYLQQRDPEEIHCINLDEGVSRQLWDYIVAIAANYNDNPFHCFDHASHVGMSTAKLLSRIIKPEEVLASESMPKNPVEIGEILHQHSFGITSDPLTQFACVFSALIHDADHPGVPNTCLVQEKAQLAVQYDGKSVAEQHSVDIAWSLLMTDAYKDLRLAICPTPEELKRFRQLVVNIVLATDIMDKDLIQLRNSRWEKAFSQTAEGDVDRYSDRDRLNRKATIVLEHLIQASDVAHTMQHWHIYLKWNERLFDELYAAFTAGRLAKNPAEFWYQGELGFFDNYIIPLAKKLRNCGVFGVSSDEYLTYALKNREEWALRGNEIVASMMERKQLDESRRL